MAFSGRTHTFDAFINGSSHEVEFTRKKGTYFLKIDGDQVQTYKPSSFLLVVFEDINDYEYEFEGAHIVIAVRYNKVRLAINGVYTDTGEKFVCVRTLPRWGMIFVVAILLPPFFVKAQTFDIIIAVLCSYLCTYYILKNPDLKADMARRAVYCAIVTVFSWLSLWFFNMM